MHDVEDEEKIKEKEKVNEDDNEEVIEESE